MEKRKGLQAGNRKSLIFYIILMAIPTIQFVLFYVCVNFNSFLLAFRNYITPDSYEINLTKNFALWFTPEYESLRGDLFNSLLAFVFQFIVVMPLGVFFAFYIFKKLPFAGFFRVMLFIPSIVSALVVLKIYKEFLGGLQPVSLLDGGTKAQKLAMVFLGNLLVGFGTSVLLYANKMASISPEIIESAQLDGVSGIKEFIYIIFPMIYPTISVFLITSIASFFTNQLNNFALYAYSATETSTFGYTLFLKLASASGRESELSKLSALGLMATAVTIPLTFLVKHFVTKYGPSEE